MSRAAEAVRLASAAPTTVLDAFLVTAAGVLQEATGIAVVTSARTSVAVDPPIAVIIHARGDLSGVTWRFPHALVARAAWALAPDLVPDSALCELAASELANMLTGRGLATLAELGVAIEIEPPQITVACAPGVSGLLATELGPVEVTFHRAGRAS